MDINLIGEAWKMYGFPGALLVLMILDKLALYKAARTRDINERADAKEREQLDREAAKERAREAKECAREDRALARERIATDNAIAAAMATLATRIEGMKR